MKNNNTVTRVAVVRTVPVGDYADGAAYVRRFADFGFAFGLDIYCQSNGDAPDCFYGLKVLSQRFHSFYFANEMSLLAKIHKAYSKEQAPRARIVAGKPFLDNCELTRLEQACRKLKFQVRCFSSSRDALDWVNESPAPALVAAGGAA
jgi:hypothetical protein